MLELRYDRSDFKSPVLQVLDICFQIITYNPLQFSLPQSAIEGQKITHRNKTAPETGV
jgi:hypothetical protein